MNELSLAPDGVIITDCAPIIKEFIDTFYAARNYKLEKLKVPLGFAQALIAGNCSLKYFYDNIASLEERQRIIGFLANIAEDIDPQYQQDIQDAEIGRLFEVSLGGVVKQSLKEANICKLPLLSFRTSTIFQVDRLYCTQYIINSNGERFTQVRLDNLYHVRSVDVTHRDSLMEICHRLTLAKRRWDPVNNPCWRTSVTKEIIDSAKYPDYEKNDSIEQRRAKNMAVATAVLSANGWQWDHNVTRYNRHRQEIWRIFTNNLSNENVFISVDLTEGEFEIQGRRGNWVNTTFFSGYKNARKDYTGDNTHGIHIKNVR